MVKGEPRSEVNTKGDLGPCSRARRRNARNSSPRIGCLLGVPFLALRTARVGFEVDLVPAASQPARLSLSRAGKRPDHGRVPLAPAIGLGGISQDWHLAGAWV